MELHLWNHVAMEDVLWTCQVLVDLVVALQIIQVCSKIKLYIWSIETLINAEQTGKLFQLLMAQQNMQSMEWHKLLL